MRRGGPAGMLVCAGLVALGVIATAQDQEVRLTGTQIEEKRSLVPLKKPYEITGTYLVPEGRTLEITAGCVLLVAKDAQVTVSGTLIANGETNRQVVFKGKVAGVGGWKGLRFEKAKACMLRNTQILGAEVGLSVVGSDPIFDGCIIARCKTGVTAGDGRGPTLKNCLVTQCESHALVVSYRSLITLERCTVIQNKGFGIMCPYLGDFVVKSSIISKNAAGGIRGHGYGDKAEAHDSILIGNSNIDVTNPGPPDWDFSRNWWGKPNTQKLISKGDTANLPCIDDGADKPGRGTVRLHDFLTAEPKDCGSSLTWKP